MLCATEFNSKRGEIVEGEVTVKTTTEDILKNILKIMNWLDKTNNINTPQMNEKMELIQIVKDSPERNVQFKSFMLPWLNDVYG